MSDFGLTCFIRDDETPVEILFSTKAKDGPQAHSILIADTGGVRRLYPNIPENRKAMMTWDEARAWLDQFLTLNTFGQGPLRIVFQRATPEERKRLLMPPTLSMIFTHEEREETIAKARSAFDEVENLLGEHMVNEPNVERVVYFNEVELTIGGKPFVVTDGELVLHKAREPNE